MHASLRMRWIPANGTVVHVLDPKQDSELAKVHRIHHILADLGSTCHALL